ncbi:hypothetical protein ABKA04_004351 [Annulohypoxylon sp. FPYF3050]
MDPSDHSESDQDEVWYETMSQIEDDNSDNSTDTDRILLDLRARPDPDSEQEQRIMLSIEDDFTGFERREGEEDGDGAAIVKTRVP